MLFLVQQASNPAVMKRHVQVRFYVRSAAVLCSGWWVVVVCDVVVSGVVGVCCFRVLHVFFPFFSRVTFFFPFFSRVTCVLSFF